MNLPAPREPLAARLRPASLSEYVGQAHLLGPRAPLRAMINAGQLPSLLLAGPPGTGKTSLARLLAEAAHDEFVTLSAVSSGVADVRAVVEAAEAQRDTGRGTLLFIDEIHHFSKSQQDVLLPHVESGLLTLVGATTENPKRAINAALLSRCLLMRLRPLGAPELEALLDRAITDPRGLGVAVELDTDVRAALIGFSDGDARRLLTVTETAVTLAQLESTPGTTICPTVVDVEQAASERIERYDASGALSAFIKSIRGNDPDGAVYWLAVMLTAGEDPRVITRRLFISAGEDIGAADPRGLSVAAAASQAAAEVGMPEIQYILATASVILAGLPKSPRAGEAYLQARQLVESEGAGDVPYHLRPLSSTYRHPHRSPDFHVDQAYLPDRLHERRFYFPSAIGLEAQIRDRLARLRATS